MKQVGIWVGIIIILLATIWGLISLVNSINPTTNSLPQTGTPAPVSSQDITLGATESAKVILIEYADFQCPACKTTAGFIRQAAVDFPGKLLIVSRFFPLISLHQNSMTSAQAAFAAYKQNKFWEMSDLLYQNQDSWANLSDPQQIFTNYAKKLNLDINQFANDYNANSTKEFINNEMNEGIKISIAYTPSVFLNGKLINNSQDYETFKQAIQNEIISK